MSDVNNRTAYCTLTITNLISEWQQFASKHVRKLAREFHLYNSDWSRLYGQMATTSRIARIRYKQKSDYWQQPKAVRARYHAGFSVETYAVFRKSAPLEVTLVLPRPSRLAELYPLEYLAASVDMPRRVPNSYVPKIIEALVPEDWHHFGPELRKLIPRFVEGKVVHFSDQPLLRKKVTKEEKIDRLRSLYGLGGTLVGPRWATASGRRYTTWKWTVRMAHARMFYEREFKARHKYFTKLQALGCEEKPYQTFAEYLRSLADQIERGEK